MSIDKLINYGVKTLIPSNGNEEKTIIVIGSARGGTSMIAGMLYNLGVPMGKAVAPVFEDVRLSSAIENSDAQKIDSIINEYNKNKVWAFKRPSMIKHLDELALNVRNPHFIFVFRDIFSIANRNGISMGSGVLDSMEEALKNYLLVLDYLKRTSAPSLLCSSEKVLAYPKQTIDAIVEFCALSPSKTALDDALGFVNPESSEYLDASRINRSHGQIGAVTQDAILGWASWYYRDEPAPVEISINGVVVAEKSAVDYREKLVKFPKTRKGYCGFNLDISNLNVKSGDTIEVKVKSDVVQLKNSPWVVE